MLVVDCSGPLSGGAAVAAGVTGAMRYVSSIAGPKIPTPTELTDLHAHGVAIGFVHEDNTNDMSGGSQAGYEAAAVALYEVAVLFNDCGWGDPSGTQIGVYFADDSPQINPGAGAFMVAAQGVLHAHGIRTGYYGNQSGCAFLLGAGVCELGWGVSTWGSDVLRRCHLRQEANAGQITVGGTTCDRNTALSADFGQWPRP